MNRFILFAHMSKTDGKDHCLGFFTDYFPYSDDKPSSAHVEKKNEK